MITGRHILVYIYLVLGTGIILFELGIVACIGVALMSIGLVGFLGQVIEDAK